jgi:3-oxoacyl-[acyl-carrier-protein] synthase III
VRAETNAAGDTAHRAAEAVQQRGRAAAEALRQGTEATAEVTRQGTQAGIEAVRRASETANETVRRTTQVVAEGQRQIAHEAVQTFQDVSRKMAQVAQGTSEEVRRLATLPHAAEGGLHDMRQGMAGLIEGVVQTNLRATQELFRLTNPTAIIELQQRFARDYMDTVMQNTATLLRAVRRTADETLRPLEVQVSQRRQAHPSYRTAAE